MASIRFVYEFHAGERGRRNVPSTTFERPLADMASIHCVPARQLELLRYRLFWKSVSTAGQPNRADAVDVRSAHYDYRSRGDAE